ncbi:MAG: exopolysaccharide biosynthesis polyprenyl glycosylphosphotransferase [bacterium]|nr:exopolysaccharide biosynthesis polyprenyl glycosylphosphotransferase [bacterium]
MYRLRQLLLLIVDGSIFYLSLFGALVIRYQRLPGAEWARLVGPMGILFFLALIICFIAGLYDLTRINNTWKFYSRIVTAALVWMAVGTLFFYAQPNLTVAPKTILLLTSLIGFGLIALWRLVGRKIIANKILTSNIVFVGITPEVLELANVIKESPQLGYQTIGFVRTGDEEPTATLAGLPLAPTLSALTTQTPIDIQIIIIAPHLAKNSIMLNELYPQLFKQTEMMDLARFYEEIMGRIPPFTFSEAWFLTNLREQRKKIYDRGRIFVDYLFSLLLGLFFIITWLPIAIAIKLNSKGPIFFAQERVGRNELPFKMYKYRTMIAINPDGGAEINGPQFAAKADRRITAVGKFLRATRLDEIPQFINILKNEMGLIGPRPERPEFVAELTKQIPFYPLRHLIKPGITGWAQLKKSYYGTLEENQHKLEYDLFYIKNRGALLDVAILLRTINIVLGFMGR